MTRHQTLNSTHRMAVMFVEIVSKALNEHHLMMTTLYFRLQAEVKKFLAGHWKEQDHKIIVGSK